MALFKVKRGNRSGLPSVKTDGYAYFCTDDGSFWIDYTDEQGTLYRKQVDAGTVAGHTVEIDVPADAKFTDTLYGAAGEHLGLVKSGGDVEIASGQITVRDDSHNHIIENVDGLQTALDAKASAAHTHDDRYYTEIETDNKLSEKADVGHTHDNYETKEDATSKLSEAKNYAKEYADGVKSDLLNGAGEAYDTLKELGDLITDNADAIAALELVAAGKANSDHTHDNYETRVDATSKLAEAKAYTDTSVGAVDSKLGGKMDAVTGEQGLFVGFNSAGKPEAQELPATTLQEENKDLAQRFWRGTKTEFDALSVKEDNVTYIVEDDPEQQNICKSYYMEFDEDKWTVGDTEATFVIPQSEHGMASAGRVLLRVWVEKNGALISGTWLEAETYTTGDTAENITVHASKAFAGALMLVG